MQDYSTNAIKAASESALAYCKFVMPNDTGATGGHQYGYHIHKAAYKLVFDQPGEKGQNLDKWVRIRWQDDFETTSHFIYYGQGTRNEYRLTTFGRGFPFLADETVGSLLVLCKVSDEYYRGYILETEDEIDSFLNFFGISPVEANGIISEIGKAPKQIESYFQEYICTLKSGFPSTKELSATSQTIFNQAFGVDMREIIADPDNTLTGWVDTEYRLFQEVERDRYGRTYLDQRFGKLDELVEAANTILNRRKSRAGHSLENHLAKMFDIHELPYTSQGITEGHKKPDFIIPGIQLYHDKNYSADKLVFLAAKTTCKDRWRQVLNEAERIPRKHLFTLQQGISQNQLTEMKEEGLTLVVPEKHLTTFPPQFREDILSLKEFISYSRAKIA